MKTITWAEKEVKLACQKETLNKNRACYKSALKAYKSLISDDPSGFNIRFTRHILSCLMDGKVLMPIEDVDEDWNFITRQADGTCVYRSSRMDSLLKFIYPDGTVSFSDINRCTYVDIDTGSSYQDDLVLRVIDEMYPIIMPYYPDNNPIFVWGTDFIVDERSINSGTVGLFYAVMPSGEKVTINRYFKENGDGKTAEISEKEYQERVKKAYRP